MSSSVPQARIVTNESALMHIFPGHLPGQLVFTQPRPKRVEPEEVVGLASMSGILSIADNG